MGSSHNDDINSFKIPGAFINSDWDDPAETTDKTMTPTLNTDIVNTVKQEANGSNNDDLDYFGVHDASTEDGNERAKPTDQLDSLNSPSDSQRTTSLEIANEEHSDGTPTSIYAPPSAIRLSDTYGNGTVDGKPSHLATIWKQNSEGKKWESNRSSLKAKAKAFFER